MIFAIMLLITILILILLASFHEINKEKSEELKTEIKFSSDLKTMPKLNLTGIQVPPFELRKADILSQINNELTEIEQDIKIISVNSNTNDELSLFILKNKEEALRSILQIDIQDEEDFAFVEWLYNNGECRDEIEINEMIEKIKKSYEEKRIAYTRNSAQFKSSYHPYILFITVTLVISILVTLIVANPISFFDFFTSWLFISAFIAPVVFIISAVITAFYQKHVCNSYNVPIPLLDQFAIQGSTIMTCISYRRHLKMLKNKQYNTQI